MPRNGPSRRGWGRCCSPIATPAGHYAYAKLCKQAPRDAWACDSAVAKVSSGPWPESVDALCAATWRACTYAALLAQADGDAQEAASAADALLPM